MNTVLIPRLAEQASQWARCDAYIDTNRMPHALLLRGANKVFLFAQQLAVLLLCHAPKGPCGACAACRLLSAGNHPDFHLIAPESPGGAIKIETIRLLVDLVYLTPQCGSKRVVLLSAANQLNQASANALLKILEEPPLGVYFILVADQISQLPATLLSRCGQITFAEGVGESYLASSAIDLPEIPRTSLFAQRDLMLQTLLDIATGQVSPSHAANTWSTYALIDLVWLLYVLVAETVRVQLMMHDGSVENITALAAFFNPVYLLHMHASLTSTFKTLQQGISLNETLALESIFFAFSPHARELER